jgi:hypothetical protein
MTPSKILVAIRIKRDVRRTNPSRMMGMAFPYKKESPDIRDPPFVNFCRTFLFPALLIVRKFLQLGLFFDRI